VSPLPSVDLNREDAEECLEDYIEFALGMVQKFVETVEQADHYIDESGKKELTGALAEMQA
jgi:hypothetical protein